MTQNQIAYWNLQEQMRANRAKEALTGSDIVERHRSNLEQERLKQEIQDAQGSRWKHQNVTDSIDLGVRALDSAGKRIDSMTSNMAKLLGGIR